MAGVMLVLLIAAVAAVALLGASLLDGVSFATVKARRQPWSGARASKRVRLWAWRLGLQRRFGPPPVEARTLRAMLALSPSEFEAATATLYRKLGYHQVRVVGGAGDYAADLLAIDPQVRAVVV